jgi:hypothetical protein
MEKWSDLGLGKTYALSTLFLRNMYIFKVLAISSPAVGLVLDSGPYVEPVTASLLHKLTHYASYTAATYCKINNNSPNTAITCFINQTRENSCPQLHKQRHIQSLWEFENIEPGDTTGFLAVDHQRHDLVLSIRGSKSESNWRTNKMFTLVKWPEICSGCRAHRGFHQAYQAAKQQIVTQLKAAVGKYPDYQLIVTGHSLGGAMATMIATSLRKESELKDIGQKAHLYTYGAPKVGNPALMKEIESRNHQNYRVTKGSDPVPHVPIDFGLAFDFHQFYPQYHIKTNTLIGDVAIGDIKVCMQPKACDVQWNINKWDPHLWYFLDKKLSACSPSTDDSDEQPVVIDFDISSLNAKMMQKPGVDMNAILAESPNEFEMIQEQFEMIKQLGHA